jgi:hypothetical protein
MASTSQLISLSQYGTPDVPQRSNIVYKNMMATNQWTINTRYATQTADDKVNDYYMRNQPSKFQRNY